MTSPPAGAEPVSVRIGGGSRRAAVLSPDMAVWDGGAFFAPVTEILVGAGYRVTVFDSLSLLGEIGGNGISRTPGRDFEAHAARWAAALEREGPFDLIGGVAFGGATALRLLAAGRSPALLLSAPYRADPVLDARLGAIAALAAAGDLPAAQRLMLRRVTADPGPGTAHPGPAAAPAGDVPAASGVVTAEAVRFAHGLSLLSGLDLSRRPRPAGRVLHLYGEHSQLVSRRHSLPDRPPRLRSLTVPGAGMRPQHDNPRFVERAVHSFLKEVAP